jgi:hypothetical protein
LLQVSNPCPSGYLQDTADGFGKYQRAQLIDWLIACANSGAVPGEVLHRAVAFLDRFLASGLACMDLLHAAAMTCLWLAAKYEGFTLYSLDAYAYVGLHAQSGPGDSSPSRSNLAGTKASMLELERLILKALDYRLASVVTVRDFMGELQITNPLLHHVFCYFADMALLEYNMLPYRPDEVAYASILSARMVLGDVYNNSPMDARVRRLVTMFGALHATLSAALELKQPYNVTSKYCAKERCSVAHLAPILPNLGQH